MCFTVQLSRSVPFPELSVPVSAATRSFYHNVLRLSRTFFRSFSDFHISFYAVTLCRTFIFSLRFCPLSELLYPTIVIFFCQAYFFHFFIFFYSFFLQFNTIQNCRPARGFRTIYEHYQRFIFRSCFSIYSVSSSSGVIL